MYPQSHWSTQLTIVSSGSQFLLSNSTLFYFKSKKEFILEICKWDIYIKEHSSDGKWNYFVCSHNVCSTQGSEWKTNDEILESSLKNKSWRHLLEEIFQPAESKSLRLRSAAFETQLSGSVWGSPFKYPPPPPPRHSLPDACAKTVSSLLRETK